MTRHTGTRVVVFLAVPAAIAAVWLSMAGSLDPPAPPAPTMKTLDEVEPRIPIRAADLPLTISQSGSYYLAENIEATGDGITIEADNVTIDLMGHTLTGGTGIGIDTDVNTKNLTVRNGGVTGWASHGLDLWDSTHSQVYRVRSTGNGADGIRVQHSSMVVESTAYDNNMTGIIAWDGSLVIDCVSKQNRWGISVNGGSAVIDSVASANDWYGIDANSDSQVRGCTTCENLRSGINVAHRGIVVGNLSYNNTENGIYIQDNRNRIEGNHLVNNDVGIKCTDTMNLIVRNSASGNTTADYDVISGNDMGPIESAATSTSPWANLSP